MEAQIKQQLPLQGTVMSLDEDVAVCQYVCATSGETCTSTARCAYSFEGSEYNKTKGLHENK